MDVLRSVLAPLTIPVDMQPSVLHKCQCRLWRTESNQSRQSKTACSEARMLRASCRRACQRRLQATPACRQTVEYMARLLGAPLLPAVSHARILPRAVLEVAQANVTQVGRSVGC